MCKFAVYAGAEHTCSLSIHVRLTCCSKQFKQHYSGQQKTYHRREDETKISEPLRLYDYIIFNNVITYARAHESCR